MLATRDQRRGNFSLVKNRISELVYCPEVISLKYCKVNIGVQVRFHLRLESSGYVGDPEAEVEFARGDVHRSGVDGQVPFDQRGLQGVFIVEDLLQLETDVGQDHHSCEDRGDTPDLRLDLGLSLVSEAHWDAIDVNTFKKFLALACLFVGCL